jgi:hypothetical protein
MQGQIGRLTGSLRSSKRPPGAEPPKASPQVRPSPGDAAVYNQGIPDHVVSRPRGKENGRARHVLGRTDAAGRNFFAQGFAVIPRFMLEAKAPGAIADTTTFCGASSSASRLVKWIRPALDAA